MVTPAPLLTPHHTGVVVSDIKSAMDAYIADFGYTFFQFEVNEANAQFRGTSPSFRLRFGIGQLGLNLIELIQPVTGTTLYSQYLAEHGPGLHHLGFTTTDLASARRQFAARGYPRIEDGVIHGLVDFSYYDARELGVLIEPLQLSCDLAAFLLQNGQPYPPKSG